MLTAVIIDDEAPSRDELKALLEPAPDIDILGECANAIEGLAAIHRLRPDIVFLDIQMPRISGLEMVGMIDPAVMPRIVFVTAYDEHALKAFEEHAADYLLKPIDPQRLERTLDWLREGHPQAGRGFPASDTALRQIPCVTRSRILLIPLDEVDYVHADIAGIRVVAADREGITDLTLKLLDERTALMRCHRQYLVNPARIAEIELHDNGGGEIVMRNGLRVPVSRRHLREIKERLFLA